MTRRASWVSNICIACVLVVLGVAVFTTDLGGIFLTVGAPVSNGDRNKRNVSLMFIVDDGAEYVGEIADILKSKAAAATFFVGGKWAGRVSPALVTELAEDFEIGNHAYSNTNLTALNEAEQRKEIQACHAVIKSITASAPLNPANGNRVSCGVDMKLFLPPAGAFNKATLRAAQNAGYRTVIWSKDASTGSVFEKAAADIMNGDLVLLKPTAETFGAVGRILDRYAELGFTAVKVSDNIGQG